MKIFRPAENQPAEFYTCIHRRSLIKLLCLAILFMGCAIGGCDFHKVDASAETNSRKESNMESTQTATTIQPKIPPIDAASISETETATFALG